ncbi:hypothetical protein [Paenibacillus sp. CMAA1364]
MKRIFSLVLILLLITPILDSTAFASNTVNAKVTMSSTFVNGHEKNLNGFNISNNNYFRLRDLAEHFSGTASQFDITWNKASNAIEIITGRAYTLDKTDKGKYYSSNRNYSAKLSTSKVLVNGKLQLIKAYNIDGNNYFQLRDLASKIPFSIEYDNKSNRLLIFTPNSDHAYRVKTAFDAKDNLDSAYFPRWKSTVNSYLVDNNNGTVSVIEANEGVTIETYNKKYELSAKKKIPYELPKFGGFYSGEKYNYIAFGQDNSEEKDNKEVIRIVRYDKSFKRIDSVSIKGGESFTVKPFDAGAGRMAEAEDTLVFHTSRERYTTDDGLNHQSQLTIIVNTKTMTVTNDLGRFQENHVSHSFDQYVLFDGSTHVLVDHGDAYPRSIVLNKEDGTSYSDVNLFDIPGKIGANTTGVSVGGFEMSSNSYIVAMNSINHSLVKEYTSYEMVGLKKDQRDIILSVVPKDSTVVNNITLAKYVGTNKIASIPKLVKITDNKMMVLWQEFDNDYNHGDVKYVLIDGAGKRLDSIQTIKNVVLSECNPIISGNKIVWYTNNNGYRSFYTIPLD